MYGCRPSYNPCFRPAPRPFCPPPRPFCPPQRIGGGVFNNNETNSYQNSTTFAPFNQSIVMGNGNGGGLLPFLAVVLGIVGLAGILGKGKGNNTTINQQQQHYNSNSNYSNTETHPPGK